jgi:hypothetical protein
MHQEAIITKRLRTTQDAVDVGRELIVMKRQLGHGEFLNHLRSIGMGLDTAERCIQVSRCVEEHPDILDLPLRMAYGVARVYPEQRVMTQARAAIRRNVREKDIENAVLAHLREHGIHATSQVQCHAGVVDIVTTDAVYEIELFLSRDVFFHAIGQVLTYRQALDPSRRAVIVGLPDPGSPIADLIGYAQQFGVEVELWTIPDSSSIESEQLQALISEHAAGLSDIALRAARVPSSGDITRALDMIEQAVATIRAAIDRR